MIPIVKPIEPPSRLKSMGAVATQRLCANFDSGERSFKFNPKIYGHASVKKKLITAQHKKCCFCESRVTHIADGDVEHFRPKGGFRQATSDTMLTQPGYYWLAYEWSNLFFCCQMCNQRSKKNLFPLKSTRRRARNHHADVTNEEPLFICPDEAATSKIGFDREFCVTQHRSLRAAATIEGLDLNREDLCEVRAGRLAGWQVISDSRGLLIHTLKCTDINQDVRDSYQLQLCKIDEHIEALQRDSAEYASMARAFFRGLRLIKMKGLPAWQPSTSKNSY